MLAGVALGAINPFALGIIGAALGGVASVFLAGVFGARGGGPVAEGVRRIGGRLWERTPTTPPQRTPSRII